jgi:Zn-dependent peptidase ImmA (M78 family)/DNA-binding XRE family transcriptional regulator
MTPRVNPEMLVLARESRGYTQSELAKAVSLTQSSLSRYEAGLGEIPLADLQAVAVHLEYPPHFFYQRDRLYCASCLFHRRRQTLSLRDLKRIHAQVNILRLHAARLLAEAEIESDNRFHRLDAAKLGGPESVAQMLRHLWGLPLGPVRNVVGDIERAGGIVFRCPFDTSKVDAISQWPPDDPDMPPVFFVNEDMPGDRMRWTLAHEIGHIAMHHLPTADPEGEADRFASEFLMPAREIALELGQFSLQRAAALKPYWKTSMAALIRRARDLGTISQRKYEYLNTQLAKLGYKKYEPIPIPAEEPQMLREILEVHRQSHARSVKELSDLLALTEEQFRSMYWQEFSGLRLAI